VRILASCDQSCPLHISHLSHHHTSKYHVFLTIPQFRALRIKLHAIAKQVKSDWNIAWVVQTGGAQPNHTAEWKDC